MWPCLRSFRVVAVSTILISFVTSSLLDGDRAQHTTVEVPLASSQSQACGKPEDAASFIQAPRLPVKSLGPQSHRMDEGSSSKYALSALQQHIAVRIKTVLGVMSAHIFGLSMFTFIFSSACCVAFAVVLPRFKNSMDISGTPRQFTEEYTAKEQLPSRSPHIERASALSMLPSMSLRSWFTTGPSRSSPQSPQMQSHGSLPLFSPVSTALRPSSQLRLGIPLHQLTSFRSANGELTILDDVGNSTLSAAVRRSGTSRSIELLEKNHALPHVRVAPSSLGALAIFNSHGALYGFLETDSPSKWSVEHEAVKVLLLEGSPTGLQFSVKLWSGKAIASVGTSPDFADDGEHVEFCVEPGVDPVLIIAVVLAVMLLLGSSSPTRSPATRGRLL
mmetsp:Transcript_94542/g.148860  ORF Transcript_94542/g.148860 Transcript_94542/m.148860 type:complete len:390 (-) Transcript_94542:105-1274(-)